MKKLLLATALGVCAASASADDYKPFVIVDSSSEKDSLANDYINANITLGVKGPNKVEYSVKSGISLKDPPSGTGSTSSNIEFKIKKSFDFGWSVLPYVALRLGEKFNADTTHFTHWAVDTGLKVPLTEAFALDIGTRYRDAFQHDAHPYQSFRYHATLLYEINKDNILGLRYTTSTSTNKPEEERETWRLHYQHNY